MDDKFVLNSNYVYYKEIGANLMIINYKTILEISLRTCYKYAEFLIWRLFIYRVLKHPIKTTTHDIEYYDMVYMVSFSVKMKEA
jgi:hypothetical protein